LDELEDELEDNVLAQYRARRIEELKARARREIYGQVYHIREQEYSKEVSQAPEDTYVVLHLYAQSEPECAILAKYFDQLASKFRAVKFCQIRAQDAIHNFPSSKCPTVLVYKASHIVRQFEKMTTFGGSRANAASVEYVLGQKFTANGEEHQILQTELTSNPALAAAKLNLGGKGKGGRGRGRRDDSDDDDDSSDDD